MNNPPANLLPRLWPEDGERGFGARTPLHIDGVAVTVSRGGPW